jgi:hypothetical protein
MPESSAIAMRLMSAITPMMPSAVVHTSEVEATEPPSTASTASRRYPVSTARLPVMNSMFE